MIFQKAKWISVDNQCESPLIRKEFYAAHVRQAQIVICGLGFFALYINGKKVSDDLLTPVWSDYEKRNLNQLNYPISDTFTHRIYYLKYDIKSYLIEGINTIGVMLGNGWYNQYVRTAEGDLKYGHPKLCFEIEIINEQEQKEWVISDESLKWVQGPIVFNNIYYGEKHDLRLQKQGWYCKGYDDKAWNNVKEVDAPQSEFNEQKCPSDRIIRTVKPKLLQSTGSKKVYDVGENISGWIRLKSKCQPGEVIVVRHAEECNSDFNLNFNSTGGENQIQTDEYIGDGNENSLEPKFTYHGFRYFEVLGPAEVIECVVVHADIKEKATFESDNDMLNWLYQTYIRTQLTNMHCGVPSDCCHRERLGYTGDGQLTCDVAMLTLDSQTFYEKWIQDIADCQDIYNGHIQHTAPFYGGGGGPGGWGCAIVIVPYYYYKHFGDVDLLRKYYPNMLKWMKYMQSRMQEKMVVKEEDGGWCLGEWVTPMPVQIPEDYVNTYFYIKALLYLKEILLIIDEKSHIRGIEKEIRECKAAIEVNYYDQVSGDFCKGVQGANAFAIDIDMGSEKTLSRLVQRYKVEKEFDTGIFGTDILIDVLFKNGYGQEAFDLLTSHKENSFFKQKTSGATTLWETWNGEASHNHPMFGAVVKQLFYQILGIEQKIDTTSFESIEITPKLIEGLNWVKGSITTQSGEISVAYKKEGDNVVFNIRLKGGEGTLSIKNRKYALEEGENEIKIS